MICLLFFFIQNCLWHGLSYNNLGWKGSHVVQYPTQAGSTSQLKTKALSNLIYHLGLHQFTPNCKKPDSCLDSMRGIE